MVWCRQVHVHVYTLCSVGNWMVCDSNLVFIGGSMLPVIVSLTPNMCLANMLLTSSAMNNILMMLCSVPCVEQSVVAFD